MGEFRVLDLYSELPNRESGVSLADNYRVGKDVYWARLLRKVFEVDPLHCPRCGGELKVVSVITDPRVVGHILKHLASEACRARDPFEPRAPPRISGKLLS